LISDLAGRPAALLSALAYRGQPSGSLRVLRGARKRSIIWVRGPGKNSSALTQPLAGHIRHLSAFYRPGTSGFLWPGGKPQIGLGGTALAEPASAALRSRARTAQEAQQRLRFVFARAGTISPRSLPASSRNRQTAGGGGARGAPSFMGDSWETTSRAFPRGGHFFCLFDSFLIMEWCSGLRQKDGQSLALSG
jgi:hypothetical protein